MKLRLIATAMIFSGDQLLMMKRSPVRTLSPGMWAGIGGHVEKDELTTPETACRREIMEETGLTDKDIRDLRLRYIVMRNRGGETVQQFIYTCSADSRQQLSRTEEGELHWIDRSSILQRELPFVYRSVLEHHFRYGDQPGIHVGIATMQEDKPIVNWIPFHDPQVK